MRYGDVQDTRKTAEKGQQTERRMVIIPVFEEQVLANLFGAIIPMDARHFYES